MCSPFMGGSYCDKKYLSIYLQKGTINFLHNHVFEKMVPPDIRAPFSKEKKVENSAFRSKVAPFRYPLGTIFEVCSIITY